MTMWCNRIVILRIIEHHPTIKFSVLSAEAGTLSSVLIISLLGLPELTAVQHRPIVSSKTQSEWKTEKSREEDRKSVCMCVCACVGGCVWRRAMPLTKHDTIDQFSTHSLIVYPCAEWTKVWLKRNQFSYKLSWMEFYLWRATDV